jgi:CDGSH-type Zn-finger protein
MADAAANDMKIVIKPNGPYLVHGEVPLTLETIVSNAEGESWEWRSGRAFEVKKVYALCRCGKSEDKPYCDGTHAKIGFDGTETASRGPFDSEAKTIDGPTVTLKDDEPLCAFARFCDVGDGIWNLTESDDPARVQLAIREEGHCPSGRLVLRRSAGDAAIEPEFPKSIGLVEDPEKNSSGPLWVRGGILVESQDGKAYEVRNRVTLCRCGASSNKPFCDGSHVDAAFVDGLA